MESLDEFVLGEEGLMVGEVVGLVLDAGNDCVDGLVVGDCVDSVDEVCIGPVVRGCGVSVVEGCLTATLEDCVGRGVEVVGEIMDAMLEARKTPWFEEQHVVLEAPQQKLPSVHWVRPA